MARLLIKAKVERKNPEESRVINALSEAVKTVRGHVNSLSCFIAEFNGWRKKIEPNIAFLSESYQSFLKRTSPSALQRFFATTFAAICFLESIRTKNPDCCFIGIFFCAFLALMSFMTAIIGLLSTAPNKSVKSILNWISTMNVLSKEVSHRLDRARRVFQLTVGPEMLHTISRDTDCLTVSRWKYFFRLFFLNFLHWFSIYGTVFAVQVCIYLKIQSFVELTEVLKVLTLLIIFVNALVQDIKIRRIGKQIRFQARCLESETDAFLFWFHERSNLRLLLEQYEFLKEPLLRTLKCGNDINKKDSAHSFILFGITIIKVSDVLQDSIDPENLKTILQFLIFNDTSMCSKTKVELISDKTPDIPSVLQTKKDLADCFLHLGTVLKESKLTSCVPITTTEENKSGEELPKILNPKEPSPVDEKSPKKNLKKSKIPKKIPGVMKRHSFVNEKGELNEVSKTVTSDRHEKENVEGENMLKVTKSKDFDSEDKKCVTSIDISPLPLLGTTEKPQVVDLISESKLGNEETCTTHSDLKENKKSQNSQKAILKVTELDGFNSEGKKLPASLNNIPSTSQTTMEKSEELVVSPKSEAKCRDAFAKNGNKMETKKNENLQNKQSNLPEDMISHPTLHQEVQSNEDQDKQLNLPNDVIIPSTLDQKVVGEEEENDLANFPIGIVSHSSLAQEVQNNEDKSKVSSTTDNKVCASQFAQKGMKEEGNSETSSPADDKVLHSPIAQKCVDERDNKPLSTSVERDLSEKNRIETLPFQNTEREDMKIALEYRTHETKSDSRTISDALDKNDADGKRPEISVILENMSEIETSFISYEEKESINDPTLPSLSFRQTYDSKDSDLTEQSGKDGNVGKMEDSKTNKGRDSMNKLPLKETTVKANLIINRKNFISENPDLNHDAIVTEIDETTKFRNLDETFQTTKDVSSSAVKTQPNSAVVDHEEIHFREIKAQEDNTEAATPESGCDKSLKSVHRDKTLVDYRISLSDIGIDLKSISQYLNCYHQLLEDKEINLDKRAFEEIVREVLRNYFKHVNLPDSPIQMPTGIKEKSEETVLPKDKYVQSHPQNLSLVKGIEDNTTQAGVSVEEGDKADKEQKHPHFKKTKIKLKENGDLKSEFKQRKRKTFSRNNSVSEDPPANISGLGNNTETNDAKPSTYDYVSSSHISDLDQPSIENLQSLDPNQLNSLNLLMQSLSIDSQKQEPSDDPHSFIKRNEENIHLETDFNKGKEKISDNRSYTFEFGSPQFPSKDPQKTSNNNLEKNYFQSYITAKEAHSEIDLSKEKILKNKSDVFVFGSSQIVPKDTKKPSTNNLEIYTFGNYTTENVAHHGTALQELPTEDFEKCLIEQNSKDKQKTANSEPKLFEFGSTKKYNANEKLSNNILQSNHFENSSNENGVGCSNNVGFGDQGFPKESFNEQNMEQNSDSEYFEIPIDTKSRLLFQRGFKSRFLQKDNKKKENRSRMRIKTYYQYKSALEEEENNAYTNEIVTDSQKISSVTLNVSDKEIENEAEGNKKKGFQRQTYEDFVIVSTNILKQPNFNPRCRHQEDNSANKNESKNGKKNQISSNNEIKPCISQENGSCTMTENETPGGNQNESSTAEGKGPCTVTENETPGGKQNEPSTAEGKGPCTVTENETPGGKQNEPSTAEGKGPCTMAENETPGGKQNEPSSTEEIEPIGDKVNEISNNKEDNFCSSGENLSFNGVKNATSGGKQNESLNTEGNRPSIGAENDTSNDKQSKAFHSEKNEPPNDEGSQIFSKIENKPYCFQENGGFSGSQKVFPDGNQTKSFNSNENAPIGDQGSQTSSNKEKKSCNFGETGPCSGKPNAAAGRKQNKSLKSNEYRPISNLGNQASSDKGDRSCSSEGNESASRSVGNDISNNEIYKPHSFQENGPHSEVENESTDRKQNKSLKAEENVTSNGKDKRNSINKKNKQFNAKSNQSDTPGESEPCISKADEFHSSESDVQSSDENRPLSGEENKYCDAEDNKFGNDKKDKTFDAEGKELCNDEMHEPFHDGENTIGERTLLDSTNNSTDLHVPKSMTEKRPRSSESSATSKLKKKTSTESEVLVKNEKAMKDRLESQQNQEMQTHHTEIADTTIDAGSLNQSDKQNTKDDAGTDTITDSGYYDMDGNMSSLQNSKHELDELGKENNYNNFEESSHSFESDKNGTNTHLDHTLSDANLSELPSSGSKENQNIRMEDNVAMPEDSGMNSNQTTELNQSFLSSGNQQDLKNRSINKKINIQYSEREIKCAETSTESRASKSAGLSASDCTELSSSELALLLASELSFSDHKDCSHLNSEDISMLSEICKNSTHKDDETDLNMGLLFEENQYNVEHRSSNEEVDGQNSGTVTERAACSSESPPAAELPAQLPSKVPTSEHAESSSSIQKECSDLQPVDTSVLSENFRMNSTQIDESRDLNLSFSPDENNHSNNGEVSDKHSGTASEKADDSSECKSPKSGTVNKVPGKRVRKRHKLKDRRSSSIRHDTSDSDSRKQATWDSDICSKKAQERTVERPVHEASSSEFDGNEHHFNIEFVGDQCSGTASKGAEYSSSPKLGISRLSKSENGAIISEQTPILSPEQSESFYTRDEAPVCSLHYKNLDVDIFPPLTRLKLKLVDQNRKTRTSHGNNEALMSETSVSQSMNSEDSLASEADGSAEQAVSQTSIRQGSGVIQKYENKPLHFEDRNVILNYSKHSGSLNYSHSLSEGNQITFKSKNTKLFIKTENIDQSEGNIS